MSEPLELKRAIERKANKLFLSLADVQEHTGIAVEGVVTFDQTEQSNARRELLRIEKQAIRDKELNKKSEQNYVNGIRDLVHDTLRERMVEALADEENLYNKILGFDENLPPLLDGLSVRASSISKIEPLAAVMPWLYEDLVKMVNMPKYRRTDAKGKVVVVDSLRVALSFLGMENLKLVVPSLAFRRWIPQITDPYPEIKARLWQTALGTAMACKQIAHVAKQDEGHAFTLGMFHDVGRIVITRLYFRLFDAVQREALIEAHEAKKREEHEALTKIIPSGDFLIELIEEFGLTISAKLIRRMNFQRVFIANAMDEVANDKPVTHMSPMGKVLTQGRAYNQYRMLKAHKLITMEEAKGYLKQFYMPAGALAVLKSTDLRHLNLEFDE